MIWQGFKKLGCARSSLGALSEFVAVFDAERLKPIVESLGEKLVPIAADKRLKDIQHTLTLVDGTMDRGYAKYDLFNRPGAGREATD